MGDVHGHRDVLAGLLRDAGLTDSADRWAGAGARLWLVGDLFDRGPDGIGALELVRRLERESGGAVRCLLGNHETLILAVYRFEREARPKRRPLGLGRVAPGPTFRDVWKLNGGVDADLEALTPNDVAWLSALQPLGREGDRLLLHADTLGYLELGDSLEEVARTATAVLREGDAHAVDGLLGILSDRMRLAEPTAVEALLHAYGGRRVLHGHTPIASMIGVEPWEVQQPLVYADGRVMNVDHCLFGGGRGFVVRLDEPDGETTAGA